MTPEPEALLARARQQQGWTPDRVEALKKLWRRGLSASEIARQISGMTRNAVLGKVRRLGLMVGLGSRHEQTHLNHPARRAARTTGSAIYRGDPHTSPLQKKLDAIMANAAATPLPERHENPGSATVLTLGAHMCKWPIGSPSDPNFSFCGRLKTDEGPYCEFHHRIGHQPLANGRKPTTRGLERSLRRYV